MSTERRFSLRPAWVQDVISAKLASAYVTVDGNRYLLFQAKSLEATIEKEKEEVATERRFSLRPAWVQASHHPQSSESP